MHKFANTVVYDVTHWWFLMQIIYNIQTYMYDTIVQGFSPKNGLWFVRIKLCVFSS